ncbi:MAG: HNH endonuclease [Myxococcales bacterium]|nr:HNH endonuclease [Myxococcales bacterium]
MERLSAVTGANSLRIPAEARGLAAATAETVAPDVALREAAESAEGREAVLGERGLIDQLETIRHGSLETLAARNEARLQTRNWELAGLAHPETGVRFVRETVRLPDGTVREGVFPEFEAVFETRLPDALLEASDYRQAQYCNERLREAFEADSGLRQRFDETQRRQIAENETPDGYTWHHHQETGRMQLVDALIHSRTGHTGGREIWGGGR